MTYLCLAYYDEKMFDALSKTELDAIGSECQPCDEALRKSGHLIAQASLQPTRAATTVRARNSKVSMTDGPFAETKKQVGWGIIEARDLHEAILVASKHPAGHLGEHLGWGVEVRLVTAFEQP